MKRGSGYALLRAVVVIAFLILVGRLWYMQVVEVDAYRAQAVATRLNCPITEASRGIIYDRRGVALVRNLPRLDVTVTPTGWDFDRANQESRLLSRLLDGHPTAARIRWLVNTHDVAPFLTQPVTIKADIHRNMFYVVNSWSDQLPGVSASQDLSHRFYLDRSPFPLAHIVGYTGEIETSEWNSDSASPWKFQRYTPQDVVGQSGIESVFEHELHGINGLQCAQFDAHGNQVTPWKTVKRAIPGDGVKLTINSHFEQQVAHDLQAGAQKLGTTDGSAVVMNPWNGQILAMVSLPSFDPNLFTEANSAKRNRKIDRLEHDPGHPLFDIATGSALPPGSIYKVVTATAGLESGVITPSTIVNDGGILQRFPGGQIFHGWFPPPGLGPMDVVHAIERSSDIYFYEVAGGGPDIPGNGVGPYRLARWAHKYGLGKPTGIELPNEASGLVPTPKLIRETQGKPWTYGDSYNTGIGQGDVEVTPLQMARVVSVIANGGSLVRPTIIDAVTGPNGHKVLRGHNYGLVPDIVKPHFVAHWVTSLIGQGMRLGVESPIGTSYGEVNQATQAAGKTGTAQTPQGVAAWWMGFAPYNHPRIAVCVTLPTSGYEGAYAAAPIASKIMMDYFHKSDPNWLSKVQRILLNLT